MGLPIGTHINYWTIIGEPYSKEKRTFYPCRCLCGHEQAVRSDNLTGGHSRSHRGCTWKGEIPEEYKVERKWQYNAEANRTEKDIYLKNSYIGCFFGDWLAIAVDHSDKHGHTYYRCLNDKGQTKVARYDALTGKYGFPDGKYKPFVTPKIEYDKATAKHSNGSLGERAIAAYLDKNKIKYKREYIFSDLKGDGACLRFDFMISYNNKYILIEFQGEQHYKPIEFFGGEKQFRLQQRYDNYKRAYCRLHGYQLIEIPYIDIDKIENYLNFLQKK